MARGQMQESWQNARTNATNSIHQQQVDLTKAAQGPQVKAAERIENLREKYEAAHASLRAHPDIRYTL